MVQFFELDVYEVISMKVVMLSNTNRNPIISAVRSLHAPLVYGIHLCVELM